MPFILRQRRYALQRGHALGTLPIGLQPSPMETCPVTDDPECSGRERPFLHLGRGDRDHGPMLAVLCMEVRGRVIGTVHPDDDPVERADARHGVRLAACSTTVITGH